MQVLLCCNIGQERFFKRMNLWYVFMHIPACENDFTLTQIIATFAGMYIAVSPDPNIHTP